MTRDNDRRCNLGCLANVIGSTPLGSGGGGGPIPTDPTFNTVDFNSALPTPGHNEGLLFYDQVRKCLAFYNDQTAVTMQIGREAWIRVVNNTGGLLTNGTVVTVLSAAGGLPEIQLADANSYSLDKVLGILTQDIPDGQEGEITRFGTIGDLNTSSFTAGDIVYLSTTSGQISNTRPGYPATPVILGTVLVSDLSAGEILVTIISDQFDYEFDGCVIERQDTFVLVDTGVIYFETELIGGGDLPVQLDGAIYQLDCTTGGGVGGRARVALTPGTATVPLANFAWIELVASVPALLAGPAPPSDGRPFAFVALVTVLDAATTATEGSITHQRFTDAKAHDNRGRVSYIDERLRQARAQWVTGVDPTVTIDTVPTPDQVTFSNTSGNVYQLHRQLFPALSIDTSGIYVANASGTGALNPYQKITNLALANELVDGTPIQNRDFNLVIWGAVNKSTSECKLFVNLPISDYVGGTGYDDPDNTAVVSVPTSSRTVAFLICRIPLYINTAQTQVNFINPVGRPEIIDLRGNPIGLSGSGASGAASVFSDAIFRILNDTDSTKQLGFDCSPITTATLRTIGAPNFNMNFPTADGTNGQVMATDGAGNLTFADLPLGYATDTWRASNSTTPPPASGRLIWNNIIQSSATVIHINDINANGEDVSAFLGLVQIDDYLRLQDAADSSEEQTWQVTSVTDNTTYWSFGVTNIEFNGLGIPNNATMLVTHAAQGSGGIVFPGGVDGNIQFKEGNIFQGDSGLTWDNTLKIFKYTTGAALGAILQSDASGSASWVVGEQFQATRTASGTLSSGVITKINYDNEIYDDGSNYDPTNRRFVCPYDGIYAFSASLQLTTGTGTIFELFIFENYSGGQRLCRQGQDTTYGNGYCNCATGPVKLSAGDIIEVYGYQISGFSATIQTSGAIFSGALLRKL